MSSISEEITSKLEKLGCSAKIVAISHINEMRDELFVLRDNNFIDKKLYEDMLSGMNFDPDSVLKNTKSIIVVAAPQIISKASFQYKNNTYSLTIPPTYVADDITSKVTELTYETVSEYGFCAVKAPIPKKQLAVKSGLAKYGRNNITYINGMGSFHTLIAYYTDLDLLADSWQEAEINSDCTNCSVCLKNCPTGAISANRFLIHAEKCMTYFNEYSSPNYDFPEWIKPEWHNSLVGCMSCQLKCPKNSTFVNKHIELAAFTEEETKLLLDKVPLNILPKDTVKKLNNIAMTSNYSFLSRNIGILLTDTYKI